jgi:hypothetical protein
MQLQRLQADTGIPASQDDGDGPEVISEYVELVGPPRRYWTAAAAD